MTEDQIIAKVRSMADGLPESRRYLPLAGHDIAAVEAQIGFALPALLVRVYTEIGDGGFGPGYGMEGLRDAARIYVRYRDDPYAGDWTWPVGMLPLLFSSSTLWPPLASALISGLVASTGLTLLVVPAVYTLLDRTE